LRALPRRAGSGRLALALAMALAMALANGIVPFPEQTP
jgi:hypothetical protein